MVAPASKRANTAAASATPVAAWDPVLVVFV